MVSRVVCDDPHVQGFRCILRLTYRQDPFVDAVIHLKWSGCRNSAYGYVTNLKQDGMPDKGSRYLEHDPCSRASVGHVQIGCGKIRVVFLRLIDQIMVQYHLREVQLYPTRHWHGVLSIGK